MASGFVINGWDGRMGGFWNSWKQSIDVFSLLAH